MKTGHTFYQLRPGELSYAGSTRKLFSVGVALNALGADHRQTTPVYRQGTVVGTTLTGDLILVGGGDMAFGGRRITANTLQFSDFDHNDANGLKVATLTPQDPLYALDVLAKQVRAFGIRSVHGNVAVDDRLFHPYRVPNGDLLITPIMVNENMVDVSVKPGAVGQPASMTYRPQTAGMTVRSTVRTGAAGSASTVTLSHDGISTCIGKPHCTEVISGSIPADYRAPLAEGATLVRTFRVDNPDAFARSAFIDALARNGVKVSAAPVSANPRALLPATMTYPKADRVADFQSAPYAQTATVVMKVSLNLGANLSLSLFGLTKNQKTVAGSLAAEMDTLIKQYGVPADQFTFPTNGSGTPDSQASPTALVQMLTAMSRTPAAATYRSLLPILGVDGSLAHSGTSLPAKGHVQAKPGTTVLSGPDGKPELKAQNLAGYITTKSGRTVAYALMVNDVGPLEDFLNDISGVFGDEAAISNVIYETL